MNQTVEKRLDGASVGDWIRNNTNLLLMFALIIVGALTSDNFFSMDNILNVLRRITVNGMLAVACTMTLLVGGFDLSIGHVMALSAVLCIGFEKSTGSGAVGIVVALAAGLVLGLINGLLMKLTRGGSGEGFMITLATGMMAQALAKWYCAGSEIIRIDLPAEIDWFKQLGQGNLLGFPICTLIWIAVMVILQIVIKKTTFGRQMLLTGANKKSAFLAGINVNRVKVIAYTVAGFCCGIVEVHGSDTSEVNEVLTMADERMYEQKRQYHMQQGKESVLAAAEAQWRLLKPEAFDYDQQYLYDALVESTDNYLYVCDMATNTFRYSRKLVEEFAFPGEVIQNAADIWRSIIHPADWERFWESNQAISDGRTVSHEVEYRARNRKGQWIKLHCRGHVAQNSAGEPRVFAGFISNEGQWFPERTE